MDKAYCESFTTYQKRKSSEVKIGNVIIGGTNEICLQTMTNTLTSDIEGTANQVIQAFNSGAQIVRITVPSLKDVEYLKQIKSLIRSRGFDIPLVADIHFNQKIAFEAAKVVEKVRINPGNFADTKKFQKFSYTDDEYIDELKRIENEFIPLLAICKEHNTAMRIGTNHGSLSDRIMSRYGDTPAGMAESAMEFLRICKNQHFSAVVISMKASNTLIMLQATRLLVAKMNEESMHYPIHLGVTEAGEGEDGRIKSAVGIGALLADGIGDTIRVSLTEPPESEIPVARKLATFYNDIASHQLIETFDKYPINPYQYNRRKTQAVYNIGKNNFPVVITDEYENSASFDLLPDYTSAGEFIYVNSLNNADDNSQRIPFYTWTKNLLLDKNERAFIGLFADEISGTNIEILKTYKNKILILETRNKNGYADQRAAIVRLINNSILFPVILKRNYAEDNLESFQLKSAADLGGLFLDGLSDGIWLTNSGNVKGYDIVSTAFSILQACRMRMSRTEFISCPSCGRTLFNLQETTRTIRDRTSHLKGLKIGIMGCIVNGLGEMADADYGYIGSGIGKVNLYYSKELIKKGIPENNAVEELIALIKEKGDWVEPE